MTVHAARSPLDDRARIVVTGARGFVGSHLCPLLAAKYPQAEVLTAGREPECDLKIDLRDGAAAGATLAAAEPAVLVHLAGEASVAGAGRDAAETWRLNFVSTLAIAEAIAQLDPPVTLLFASSAEVYGQAFNSGIVTERTPPRPQSIYAQTKLATEQMLASVLSPAASLIVARPSNHIGPGQSVRFAVPSFAAQIAASERHSSATIEVGNLDAERDFLDVRDVVAAYAELIARYHFSATRSVFNISSGGTRTVRSVLDRLVGHARVPFAIHVEPSRMRAADIPIAEVASAAIRKAIGWAPVIPFEQTASDVMADARARVAAFDADAAR